VEGEITQSDGSVADATVPYEAPADRGGSNQPTNQTDTTRDRRLPSPWLTAPKHRPGTRPRWKKP